MCIIVIVLVCVLIQLQLLMYLHYWYIYIFLTYYTKFRIYIFLQFNYLHSIYVLYIRITQPSCHCAAARSRSHQFAPRPRWSCLRPSCSLVCLSHPAAGSCDFPVQFFVWSGWGSQRSTTILLSLCILSCTKPLAWSPLSACQGAPLTVWE